jgi:hypothetical protein
MDKKFDESLDHVIRNEDDKVFIEPSCNDGVWLSILTQRGSEGNICVGTSMPIAQAIQMRDALDAVIAGLALPVFTVEVLTKGKNHKYTMDVHAKDEDAAIDCVLQQSFDTFRVLTCGEVEVIL